MSEIAKILKRSPRGVLQRATNLGLRNPLKTDRLDSPDPKLKKPKPTKYEPGSPEKIDVLRQRVASGEDLWHEDDPRFNNSYTPDSPFFSQGIRQYFSDDSQEPEDDDNAF